MKVVLRGFGYEIFQALSGEEALLLIREHRFACILLDVQMPGMDGFETAMHIRARPDSQTTPIIFVTANHLSDRDVEIGYGAGAVDYLFKPINIKILTAKVAIFVELFLQSEVIKQKNELLEEALIKAHENQRLKDALSNRDEFLSLASHELKTPITPLTLQMQTFINLFQTGLYKTIDPEKLQRMLQTSQGQIDRLARLIDELVDVSRITNNKLELNPSVVNIVTLTEKVINDFQEEINQSGCQVSFHCDGVKEGFWDAFRIEQVIVNLLTNALKYGAAKPIEISIIQLGTRYVRFSMLDHGIGIAPENLSRIFERFERAVSGDSYSGLGLGLFISNDIVAQHKGSLSVESQLGVGSVFHMDLPISN